MWRGWHEAVWRDEEFGSCSPRVRVVWCERRKEPLYASENEEE